MNIIELAQKCQLIGMRPHLDGIYQEAIEKFAALVAAQERKELEKIDWTALMREGSLVTWGDAQELGDRVLATIRARGTT